MTWTRLTDNWCDDKVFRPLDTDARWHYLCMIQACCRNDDYDGVMRLVDAERASDVPDRPKAIGDLIAAGLVRNIDGATLKLVRIEQHVLPPHLRDPERKERQRAEKRRSRLHAKDNHTECLPKTCPHAVGADVSADRSADIGSGRAVTGRDLPGPQLSADEEEMLASIDRSDEYMETWGEAS